MKKILSISVLFIMTGCSTFQSRPSKEALNEQFELGLEKGYAKGSEEASYLWGKIIQSRAEQVQLLEKKLKSNNCSTKIECRSPDGKLPTSGGDRVGPLDEEVINLIKKIERLDRALVEWALEDTSE